MDNLFTILDGHRNLLRERGYDEKSLHSLRKDGWFIERVRSKFSEGLEAMQVLPKTQAFSQATAGFFGEDVVEFIFHYETSPARMDLELKKVTGRLGETRLEMELEGNRQLMPANVFFGQLVEQRALHRELVTEPIEQEEFGTFKSLKL